MCYLILPPIAIRLARLVPRCQHPAVDFDWDRHSPRRAIAITAMATSNAGGSGGGDYVSVESQDDVSGAVPDSTAAPATKKSSLWR